MWKALSTSNFSREQQHQKYSWKFHIWCYNINSGISKISFESFSMAVVLKREQLGSLREEFLIPGRKFVPGRNWGGKAVDEKTLSFYY